jgi:hypothetical protein
LFVCEGTNGWRRQSDSAASGLPDTGSDGLVKRTGPNQTAAAIEGVDYYKPGGTPVAASDLPDVATLTGSNTFTGSNVFTNLKVPSGSSLETAQRDEASEAGRVYVNTTAPAGQQLFVCEGINGWRLQSAPAAPSGLADTGSNGLVKRTGPNQTAAAVEGVDYYKPGGAPISASDLPGIPRLASSNTFTGLNIFAQLKAPSGSSPDAAQCNEVSEAGKLYVNTAAPTGQQLFVCEGINGWRLQSAPAAPSGLADTGSNGLVKRTGPNQTAAAVECRLLQTRRRADFSFGSAGNTEAREFQHVHRVEHLRAASSAVRLKP